MTIIFLLVGALPVPAYASDWVRLDMSSNAGNQFFTDLDGVEPVGGEVYYPVQMIRPDNSFVDIRLLVNCNPPGHSIKEITEFNDAGCRVAHYKQSDYRIEISDELVFKVLVLTSCDGHKLRSTKDIKKIRGLREYLLSPQLQPD